jgi:hypothetical protein
MDTAWAHVSRPARRATTAELIERQSSVRRMELGPAVRGYVAMPDFPVDPELRVRVSPPAVLRRTTEAVAFVRKMALNSAGRSWKDLLQEFEAARDEWSAMEAVVHLELLLEATGLLMGDETDHASASGQGRSRAA